eukprot:2002965-Rhodomonas_salina.1
MVWRCQVEDLEDDAKEYERVQGEMERMRKEEEKKARESEDTSELLEQARPLARRLAMALRQGPQHQEAPEDTPMEPEEENSEGSDEDWKLAAQFLRIDGKEAVAEEVLGARERLRAYQREEAEMLQVRTSHV